MMRELREAIEETDSADEIANYLRAHAVDEFGAYDEALEWLTGEVL